MSFKIPRRLAAIAGLNIRTQHHGKDKVKACDISVEFTGDLKLLNQLLPTPNDEDNDSGGFFFTVEGHLRVPTLKPLKLDREPEGLQVTLFDRKENPIVLSAANAKDFTIELLEGACVKVSCKIQAIPDKGYVERLKDILGGSVDLLIEATQDDLFSRPTEEDERKNKAQGELLDQALDGKRGKGVGRAEGLRQPATKEPPAPEAANPVDRLSKDVEAVNGKDGKGGKPAKKKSASKKKS